MDSAQKTLIEIASISQDILSILVRNSGGKTVESFQLDKIVVGCGTILAILNKTSFPVKDPIVDDRLSDWLSREEPRICLGVLKKMRSLLNAGVQSDHGIQGFLRSFQSVSGKNNNAEAIGFFQKNMAYFHFLLVTETWNCESSNHHRSPTRAQSAVGICLDKVTSNESNTQTSRDKDAKAFGVQHAVKKGRRKLNSKKLNIILEWLNAMKCGETYERTLLLRQPDTCTWLPNTDAYKTWRKVENSFLWLHGKAGAGKSVLAAFIIDALKNSLRDEALALFFCDFRHERSTKALEVMRSLLAQLLQLCHHYTVDAGDLIEELVVEKDGTTSIVSNVILLAHYVSRVAKLYSRQPFIVIDALDECKDIERLLDALLELTKGGGVRLLVTSRPLLVIKTRFSHLPAISMDAMKPAIFEDIKLHVTQELDSHLRLRILDEGLKDEIYEALCRKADGMFRWVGCQLSVLKRCVTAVRIREALDDLPTDLNETYERILMTAGKDEHEKKYVRHALDWLVAAMEPLRLSQIVEGLSVDLTRRALDRDFGPVHGLALLDILGSLVVYDEATDIVILSHSSVKEYLTGRSTCSQQHVGHSDAHEQLALRCMCYVGIYLRHYSGQDIKSDPFSLREPSQVRVARTFHSSSSRQLFPEAHHLLDYVISHGLSHLSHVNPRKPILKAIETLQSDVQLHPSEWARLREVNRSGETSCIWPGLKHDFMLFILIGYAPEQLLRLWMCDARLEPIAGKNPLVYAAMFRKIWHARFLLSKGASVNLKGWDIPNYHHHLVLPLEAAMSRGDHRLVDLFLTEGSVVPHELIWSMMMHPIFIRRDGHTLLKLLQTDELAEWATTIISADEGIFLRAFGDSFFGTSEEVLEKIERRLIQIGCNPPTLFDDTRLRHAVSAGHIATVKRVLLLNNALPRDIVLDAKSLEMVMFLLSMGCDATAVSSCGSTALHLIIDSVDDSLEIIEVLVCAGCDPCASNLAGVTPLHVAARTGKESVIEYLLLLGIPLPSDILLVAHPSLMPYLLSEGADIHAIATNGNTVLHAALRQCCHGLISRWKLANILIDMGCDPHSRNGTGATPLDFAVKEGDIPAMEYLHSLNVPFSSDILFSVVVDYSPGAERTLTWLIDKGADIHVTSPQGDTLPGATMAHFTFIMEEQCLSRVKILLDAGCDPHACNAAGETLLHAAVRKQYFHVVEYLLSLNIPVPPDVLLLPFNIGASLHGCNKMIRFFLDREPEVEIDIHAVAKNGNTLLHFATAVSTEEDALDLVKRLVASGCNPHVSNIEQETPLHIATQYGHISIVDYFLSLGLSLPPDILLSAVPGCVVHTEMISYLISKGANASVVGRRRGNTPIHELCTFGFEHDQFKLEALRILLDAGCDPRSENAFGETPIHSAAADGLTCILEEFLSRGIPLPDDIFASASAKTIRFLLDRGMDVQSMTAIANQDGKLLLHALQRPSLEEDYLERARILIETGGCDPSLGYRGYTPMHVAVSECNISVVEYLLSRGAALPDDILFTAVQTDMQKGDTVLLFHILIKAGANTNATMWSGDNPLQFVVHYTSKSEGVDRYGVYHNDLGKSCELVKVLLDGGSNPYARNLRGETALDIAERKSKFFKENFLRLVKEYESRDTIPSS